MGANASWQCCRFREARKCSDDSLSGLTLCDKLISSYPLYAKRHSDELCYYFLDSDPLGEEQTPFGDFDGGYEDCEGCETDGEITPGVDCSSCDDNPPPLQFDATLATVTTCGCVSLGNGQKVEGTGNANVTVRLTQNAFPNQCRWTGAF